MAGRLGDASERSRPRAGLDVRNESPSRRPKWADDCRVSVWCDWRSLASASAIAGCSGAGPGARLRRRDRRSGLRNVRPRPECAPPLPRRGWPPFPRRWHLLPLPAVSPGRARAAARRGAARGRERSGNPAFRNPQGHHHSLDADRHARHRHRKVGPAQDLHGRISMPARTTEAARNVTGYESGEARGGCRFAVARS